MAENNYSFFGGFAVSVLGNFKWLYDLQVFNPQAIALEWAVKVLGTIILGIVGGLAGLFAKDLYKWLKRKFTGY